MLAYRHPGFRPAIVRIVPPALAQARRMGAVSSMTVGDWLLLLGGGIVGGAGVNGLVGNLHTPGINAISIALNLVLTAVGGTLFVDKFSKLTA